MPWKRYGHDRLYVNTSDGRTAACFDRRTGHLALTLDVDEQSVREILAPHLNAPSARAPADPAAPTSFAASARSAAATPATAVKTAPVTRGDLAANPPGAAIEAKLAELTPSWWRALLDRMRRRDRPDTAGWRTGLAGEQLVAAELEPLTAGGWRVLHSIPLPRNVDIDHLLVGPGGVFTVNTKYHRGSRIWVGDEAVSVSGRSYPYTRKSRAEARRASAALTRACGFPVAVAGVLAFVEAESLTVVPSLRDVYATHHTLLGDVFAGATGVWAPTDVEAIHTRARDPSTWLDA
ncbi:nuclease-related domain-containing protein [Frankia sp. AgKG'84/4]|uniref:nuclease-related domain-containing protein n=1 Tax=Frankia sp. AgKG'84/4 TaxID=573490 RepID=UPI00200E3C78|nr:nuclease-related domain-containing protein [Frankia sp. AgKG'84/4]MCL9794695.1 NERD domain-containing protein [Frankia sp. AgKG'84/4]